MSTSAVISRRGHLRFFADGVLRGAAELRLLEHPGEAEAALSIERAWQSRRVGSALFERVLLVARNRRIESSA
jgi:GNAT superfamily N-acetyltransferase